jgi:hypothetical protein
MFPALVGLIVLYLTSIACTSVIRLRFQAGTSNRICSFGFLMSVYMCKLEGYGRTLDPTVNPVHEEPGAARPLPFLPRRSFL